jgi:hypothetical protein
MYLTVDPPSVEWEWGRGGVREALQTPPYAETMIRPKEHWSLKIYDKVMKNDTSM